jgi:hypothetical protein
MSNDEWDMCNHCEKWNKLNPNKSIDPFHSPFEPCGFQKKKKVKLDEALAKLMASTCETEYCSHDVTGDDSTHCDHCIIEFIAWNQDFFVRKGR